jgi:predicted transposase YbfD/YdcC
VDAGADYVLTVKENQSGLYGDILESFTQAYEKDFEGYAHDRYETEERGHGRHEKRLYTVLYHLEGIKDRALWKKLTAIGTCYSERTVGGITTYELRLFVGSRQASAKVYGGALRGHWGIENNLHWQLDVILGEDDSRIQDRNTAQNMALLRKWALSLLKQHPDKRSIAVKQFSAAMDTDYLQQILKA